MILLLKREKLQLKGNHHSGTQEKKLIYETKFRWGKNKQTKNNGCDLAQRAGWNLKRKKHLIGRKLPPKMFLVGKMDGNKIFESERQEVQATLFF